jgi:hypothetical protein
MKPIYYHSIALKKNKNWFRNYLTVEFQYFEEQLKLFKFLNLYPVFLDEYMQTKRNGGNTNNVINIQFDDGYLDNYVFAYPLLKKYGFKGTIFVNPQFVDERSKKPRYNLDDYWNGKISLEKLNNQVGFLNWEEMRIMEQSGTIEIQSHTLTHTKYYSEKVITGFHHPGADCLYPIGNQYPEEKPYYINNPDFEKLIPYGTPFFKEKSAIMTPIHVPNPIMIKEIVDKLSPNTNRYNFNEWYQKIFPIYNHYVKLNTVFSYI